MLLAILWILLGGVLTIKGADWLTDGAVNIAERFGVPQIIIGLTIVAFGTSAPEFFVSLTSAVNGTADLAVGNVVGSNTFNTLGILGASALVAPIAVSKATVRKDIPFAVVASIALIALCVWDKALSRWDALVLLVFLSVFFANTFFAARRGKLEEVAEGVPEGKKSVAKALGFFALGLAALVVGSNVFVKGATTIAEFFGVSQAIIGLTIVAVGTSLPELATSLVAARKGNSAIAIGNVVGSNVLNIFLILGLTGVISPMSNLALLPIDYFMLLFSMLLVWYFSYSKFRIERWEGALLLALYIIYVGLLIAQTQGFHIPAIGL